MDNNNDTNSEITALKNQVFALLVAMVVVTGSFTVYLYRQDSLLGKQYTMLNAQYDQTKSSVGTFLGQLVAYSQKHPEFTPLLKKYGIIPGPAAPSAPPSTAPAIPGK